MATQLPVVYYYFTMKFLTVYSGLNINFLGQINEIDLFKAPAKNKL